MLEHPPPVPAAILMAKGNAIRKHFQLIIDTSLSAGLHFNVILGETAAVLFWCVSGFPPDCTAHSPAFLQALLAVAYTAIGLQRMLKADGQQNAAFQRASSACLSRKSGEKTLCQLL